MRTKKDKTLDLRRETWGRGEWDDEPDICEWEYKGLTLRIRRNELGNLCGYVGVNDTHPYFSLDMDDKRLDHIGVHGGITFGGLHGDEIAKTDLWFIGFDCAHAGDLIPFSQGSALFPNSKLKEELEEAKRQLYGGDTYKDIKWVKKETERLADQLLEMT